MKRRAMLPWILVGGLTLALLTGMGHRRDDREASTMPVLQRLRSLGELHTARFEYSDVVDHSSYQEPQGLLASLPGADSVARATTENKALIDVRGSVEAGVDLRHLQAENTPAGLRITLPKPRAYRPQVEAKLFSVKSGLFWRDDEITLGAVEEARTRLAGAAVRQGLLKNAREQATIRVRALAETFGAKLVEIRFDES